MNREIEKVSKILERAIEVKNMNFYDLQEAFPEKSLGSTYDQDCFKKGYIDASIHDAAEILKNIGN